MSDEKGNFRKKLFGGFDESDVIRYIERISRKTTKNEAETENLRDEIARLTNENAQLRAEYESEREELMREIDALRAEKESLAERYKAESAVHRRELAVLHEKRRGAEDAERLVVELYEKCGALNRSIEASEEKARTELGTIEASLSALSTLTADAEEKLGAIRDSIKDRKEG